MKVTGNMLRQAMRRWDFELKMASTHMKESLWVFESDPEGRNLDAKDLMDQKEKAERAIALLQELQVKYNLTVQVVVKDTNRLETMSLCRAVKIVGGMGRLQKAWEVIATDTGEDRYSIRGKTRDKDHEVATRAISAQTAREKARHFSKLAGSLREAIERGNQTEVEFEVSDWLLNS